MPRQKQQIKEPEAVLLGREAEFVQIETLILTALKDGKKKPLSVYLNGVPGTGKTATTRAVVRKLQMQRKKFSFIFVDCFEDNCSKLPGLYRKVLENLDVAPGPVKRLETQVNSVFEESETPILLLLDEIDNLSAQLLYKIFAWPVTSSGKVILIGIANSLGLTERLLPKLKTVLSPQVVTFAPYNRTQLTDILKQKFSDREIDPKALDLCARKVLAITGDVRRAIDITKQMLEAMKSESDGEEDVENIVPLPLKRASSASPARTLKSAISTSIYCTPKKSLKRPANGDPGNVTPKSACREVLNIMKKVSASPLQRSRLPQHPRILLATFMHLLAKSMASGKPGVQRLTTTRAKLYSAYFKVCDQLSFQPLSDDELEGVYNILESQSMISLKPKGGLVVFEVEFELAKEVINDDVLLSSIESVTLP